jgi:hypothetical protein
MVNNATEILIFATPAVASAAVTGAAWWTKHGRATLRAGRAAAISVGRAAAQRWIPAALAALSSVTVGVLAYLGRALEVSSGQALHGAVIATLATAVALGLYWALGIVARRVATVVGLWALSLVPLYSYAFFAWIAVAGYTQCGPQAYECPL